MTHPDDSVDNADDSSAPKRRPLVHFVPGAVLLLGAALSLLGQWRAANAAPAVSDWKAAAEHVVARLEREETVRVHPSWTESPLPYLTHVGNQVQRQHRPQPEDFIGHRAVWVLSESGRLEEALARLPFNARASQTWTFGEVVVVQVPVPVMAGAWTELRDNLALAEVTSQELGKTGNWVACQRWSDPRQRWECPGGREAGVVEVTVMEVEDDPRRCLLVRTPAKGGRMRLRFAQWPLDGTLRFRAGMDLRSTRLPGGQDVHYRLWAGEQRLLERRLSWRESHWSLDILPTGAQTGQSLTLEVWSEASSNRNFCFNAWRSSE